MAKVAKKFKIKLSLQYKGNSSKDSVEIVILFAKKMLQKYIQDYRRKTYHKLINSSSKKNKIPKKRNPKELTMHKRTKGEFDTNHFIHFLSK